ncbi:hypothetical protein P175DRAFT_0552985 [Aspergillus ochraceoroseus IBT 24754]|uniref:Apple domain-containing protein n=1 Tax=Aspergillus ochraceoroseus IBT 24754 TaxID=1392256 RepID=A0A2T5M556_9EURO|nr:uncharacterized protein P175DRAFT_0552985 [Aspergillus ochraceoroseus IBT 24754]PTU23671.1 hypothetical protein P175DRAFT_0552985 [Aspergillus ochraceoroseus IBT 24754]
MLLLAQRLLLGISFPGIVIAQQAQAKCASGGQTGAAAYSDCCPGVGNSPVTFGKKQYQVVCDKEIKFAATRQPNPLSCAQACNLDPNCVTAYWMDTVGGICTLYVTSNPAVAGTKTMALIPLHEDENECNKKITDAVKQCQKDKDTECNRKIKQCQQDKDTECNRKIKQCQQDKDTECNRMIKQCQQDKDTECNRKIKQCQQDKDTECNRKINDAKRKECQRCRKTCPKCPKCPKPPKTEKPKAPIIPGCGAGTVHGPYPGGHYYASYVGCTGGGNPSGALRISSNQQQMDVCVQMCLRNPSCVLAIREHARSTGMASRCSMKSTRAATFAKSDNDLILKIK